MSEIHFNKPMRRLLERLNEDRSGVVMRGYEVDQACALKDNGIVTMEKSTTSRVLSPGPATNYILHLTPFGRKWIDQNKEKFTGKKDRRQ